MKRSIIAVLAVSAISTLGSSAAFAQTEREMAAYGYTSNATPSRTITVNASTRHINVTRLETVALKVGDNKTVTWTFDTLGKNSFPLSKVVPGADQVTVYLEESPLYSGS